MKKRTKAKKTNARKKRRIPLAKPATRKRAARIVGRAGGYATARKRRRKRNNVYALAGRKVARRNKRGKQLTLW
ncbi:hypothetical protein OpiT1DRAFT_01246 [Opitutaceae bacterium TAV1]|nr:hypothetical protein OpiT1DRAFT_01246 [Opitutaceae bacterium TAV1]